VSKSWKEFVEVINVRLHVFGTTLEVPVADVPDLLDAIQSAMREKGYCYKCASKAGGRCHCDNDE